MNPISPEQREEIQKAMHVLDNAIPHTSSIRKAYKVLEILGPEWIRALLSSEQAWREEVERIKQFGPWNYAKELELAEAKSDLQKYFDNWHLTMDDVQIVRQQLNKAVEVLQDCKYQIEQSNHPAGLGLLTTINSTLQELRDSKN